MVFSKNTSWSVDIAETCNNGISPGLSIKVISYAAPFVVIDDIDTSKSKMTSSGRPINDALISFDRSKNLYPSPDKPLAKTPETLNALPSTFISKIVLTCVPIFNEFPMVRHGKTSTS